MGIPSPRWRTPVALAGERPGVRITPRLQLSDSVPRDSLPPQRGWGSLPVSTLREGDREQKIVYPIVSKPHVVSSVSPVAVSNVGTQPGEREYSPPALYENPGGEVTSRCAKNRVGRDHDREQGGGRMVLSCPPGCVATTASRGYSGAESRSRQRRTPRPLRRFSHPLPFGCITVRTRWGPCRVEHQPEVVSHRGRREISVGVVES